MSYTEEEVDFLRVINKLVARLNGIFEKEVWPKNSSKNAPVTPASTCSDPYPVNENDYLSATEFSVFYPIIKNCTLSRLSLNWQDFRQECMRHNGYINTFNPKSVMRFMKKHQRIGEFFPRVMKRLQKNNFYGLGD